MKYAQVTVTGSGTILLGRSGNVRNVELTNQGTAPIFIGDRSVTSGTGFAVVNGGTPPPPFPVVLDAGEELAAITAGANSAVLDILVDGDL